MIRVLKLCLFFFLTINSFLVAQNDIEFSLLTVAPGDNPEDAFGHSALRLKDDTRDVVFNYGIYDFDTPGFLMKFMRGKLLYKVGVYNYSSFLNNYYLQKRSIREQPLYLTKEQEQKLVSFLKENMKEENLYYLYDFFFDNCSTRIRDGFEQNLDGFGYLDTATYHKTHRMLIGEYVNDRPWLDFGIDLIIGANADRPSSFREHMFLPDYLHDYMAEAYYFNGKVDTLLVSQDNLVLDFEDQDRSSTFPVTPLVLFGLLLLLELAFVYLLKSEKATAIYDRLWWVILGICSIIMMFMWFATDHRACSNNWNLLWANPFILFFLFKNKAIKKYTAAIVYICSMFAFFFSAGIIPQQYNYAVIFIILITMHKSWRRTKIYK